MGETHYEIYDKQLIEIGFDYIYNKPLLDNLIKGAKEVKDYLKSKDSAFMKRACHFVENHDEQRIVFMTEGDYRKEKAAGTIAASWRNDTY